MRFAVFVIIACLIAGGFILSLPYSGARATDMMQEKPTDLPHATFAGGCFWCLESEFRGQPGVAYTVVGYTGGVTENPTYEQVSSGATGHAEAVEIYYDPQVTDYEALLRHFLTKAHDPTQLNQQWVDKGTQYRSAIYYHDEDQRKAAQDMIAALSAEKHFKNPIVTEVKPAGPFWPAEEYHQQYYEKYKARTGNDHIRIRLKHQKKQDSE